MNPKRSAFATFVSPLMENLSLKRPHLTLRFEPNNGPPYVEDESLQGGNFFRVFRVAVMNSGEPVDAQVKIVACTPQEPQASRIGYPLQVFGAAAKTDKATINRSPHPLVFFEVVGQMITPGVASASDLHMRAAIDNPNWPRLSGQSLYLLTLMIDGLGASEAQRFIVIRDNNGKWVLRREPTP